MVLSPHIIQLLSLRCKRELRLATDYEFLALDIESVTGERISQNTIKRLTGFLPDHRTPRIQTLDVLARYLGYNNWDKLRLEDDALSNSAFDGIPDELVATTLKKGQRVEVKYSPGRRLLLLHEGEGCFLVEESERSKLQVGDEIMITHLVNGYPLLCSDVRRDGNSLGAFTGGKAQGIIFRIL